MDCNRVKKHIIPIIIAVMACVIIVQTIIAVVLWTSINRAKTMYNEALNERIEMQEEINRLTEEEVSDSYDVIPFVTEGGEEISLPPQP